MNTFLWCLAVVIAYRWGYYVAHKVVAKECKLLGKFYVNGEVFECAAIAGEKK